MRKILGFEKNPIGDLELLNLLIDPQLFDHAVAAHQSNFGIPSPWENIGFANANLINLLDALEKETIAAAHLNVTASTTVPAQAFFATTQYKYTDVRKSVKNFKVLVGVYVDYLKAHQDEEVGTSAHNVRISSAMTTQLVKTSHALIRFSTM